jgi:hypothetical protein
MRTSTNPLKAYKKFSDDCFFFFFAGSDDCFNQFVNISIQTSQKENKHC